ncbi:hypothetical protein LXL04_033654 [Taraxacum kok-saghyz]
MYFEIGAIVEVIGNEDGMDGSYFKGKVIDRSPGRRTIRLIADDGSSLDEVINIRRLRPRPPTVLARYHLGDMVDAWHNEVSLKLDTVRLSKIQSRVLTVGSVSVRNVYVTHQLNNNCLLLSVQTRCTFSIPQSDEQEEEEEAFSTFPMSLKESEFNYNFNSNSNSNYSLSHLISFLNQFINFDHQLEAKKAAPRDDQQTVNKINNCSIHNTLSPGQTSTRKIFVGGLAPTVTEIDFQELFRSI